MVSYVRIRVYKRDQPEYIRTPRHRNLISRSTTVRSLLCHPSVSFGLFCLTTLSFPHRKIRRSFVTCCYFHFVTSKKFRSFKLRRKGAAVTWWGYCPGLERLRKTVETFQPRFECGNFRIQGSEWMSNLFWGGPQPLVWAASGVARVKITINGMLNCLNYCVIFMLFGLQGWLWAEGGKWSHRPRPRSWSPALQAFMNNEKTKFARQVAKFDLV